MSGAHFDLNSLKIYWCESWKLSHSSVVLMFLCRLYHKKKWKVWRPWPGLIHNECLELKFHTKKDPKEIYLAISMICWNISMVVIIDVLLTLPIKISRGEISWKWILFLHAWDVKIFSGSLSSIQACFCLPTCDVHVCATGSDLSTNNMKCALSLSRSSLSDKGERCTWAAYIERDRSLLEAELIAWGYSRVHK